MRAPLVGGCRCKRACLAWVLARTARPSGAALLARRQVQHACADACNGRAAAMAEKYKVSDSAGGSPAKASAKKLSGNAGLVQELSKKLATQRKQVDQLVAQNAAKKSTWRWYHVAVLILVNNLLVLLVGISGASAMYDVGPIEDGSFKSGQIRAEGLEVINEDGPQTVLMESTTGGSYLTVSAAEGHVSKLTFAGSGAQEVERFAMESTGRDSFAITQAGQSRIAVKSQSSRTDIEINPDHGELVINDDLSFAHDTIRTRSSSLTLQAGVNRDIILAPSGQGIVKVESALAVDETLTVGDEEHPLMIVNPGDSTVTFGTRNRPAEVSVQGTSMLSDTLTIMSGGLEVTNGDVDFGNADVSTDGGLTVSGNVHLGDEVDDLITVRGVMTIIDSESDPVAAISPTTGNIELQGSLTVEQDTELKGNVILGSKPTDQVTINAQATSMKSLIATGDVVLGDDDDDTVTLYGSLKIKNDNQDVVFEIDPYTGDTRTDGTMTVTETSTFGGSVMLGDSPNDEIVVFGASLMYGDVTMHSSLTAEGDTTISDAYASNVTLAGMLRLRNNEEEVTFSVHPETGNVFSAGSLAVGGFAFCDANVQLGGSLADLISFHGPVQIKSNWVAEKDVTVNGHTEVLGLASVLNDVTVGGNLEVSGDVSLGANPEDEIVMRGHVLVQDGLQTVFAVDPGTGTVTTDGSLTVRGTAYFEDTVTLDAPLEIIGETTVRAGLNVLGNTSIGGNMAVGRDMRMDGELMVDELLAVSGDAWLGLSDENEVIVGGQLIVQDEAGTTQFSVDPSNGDTFVAGTLRIDGPTTFADSVVLGSDENDAVTVHGTTTLRADMTARADITVHEQLTVDGNSVMQSDLTVAGDVQLGDDASDAITLHGDLQVSDSMGDIKFAIDASTGDAITHGSMEVHGRLDIEGHLQVPEFVLQQLLVDRINERTPDEGVTIEGVLFKDGGIEWTKAHELQELVDEAGVTIEEVNFNDGAIIATGKRAGASPIGEADLLTLVNKGHDDSMTDLLTTIKYRQFYHDSTDVDPEHAPADSGAISVGTANDWTEQSTTHNAYLVFHTTNEGDLGERLRITERGDFLINTDKVAVRAETGNTEIAGDVFVGGVAEPRYLTVSSIDAEANVRILAGGEGDAMIVLKSPFVDDTMSTFQIKNEGSPDGLGFADLNGPKPVLRFSSLDENAASKNIMSLTDLGTTGELHVNGNVMVGDEESAGTHNLIVQSGAAAELLVQSGGNADATVTITSGANQNARLVLEDPAEDGEGSKFQIFNDGAENQRPALRVADGDSNVMLSVVDMGETGDLYVTGDGIIGSPHSQGTRALTVRSNETAEVNIFAGPNSDALLTITSGRNKQASLVLLDPANETEGSEFHIMNDGLEDENGHLPDFPTLRITDGDFTMLTLTDKGDTGDLTVTGSGLFGGPGTVGERTLSVSSADEARVDVVAGGESDARIVVTSGSDMDAKLIFTDPAEISGNTFEVFNDGSETTPTLRISDGFDAAGNEGNTMMKLIDNGDTGNLVVSGNGLFGRADAVGTRTLKVQSSQAADLQVISGAKHDVSIHGGLVAETKHDASVILQSGPDMDAKLVLVDPAAGFVGSKFEILNRGSAALPTMEITDGQDAILSITDGGTTGDVDVSGSGLFGGSAVMDDRKLSIQSAMEAKLEVLSGEDNDAIVTITAGVEKNARIVLADQSTSTGAHFEIGNEGTANDFPQLIVTDGEYPMLSITDRGTSGDLLVTGDGLFGGPDTVGPRSLSVTSSDQASAQVLAGDSSDAVVTISAGIDRNAKLVLQDSDAIDSNDVVTPSGSRFELLNDGSTAFPTFKITDEAEVMMSITDLGPVGDLYVSGSATFGGTGGIGDREVTVQSISKASVNIVSGPDNDAVVAVAAGEHQDAKLIMEDSADGADGSVFEIYNDGDDAVGHKPTLRVTDGSSLDSDGVTLLPGNTMITLIDQGTTSLLQVTGDGMFGSAAAMGDRGLAVQSGGEASVSVISGGNNDASVTITAGVDKDASLRFIDPASETDGAVFDIVTLGSAAKPTLEIRDSTNTLVTITDNGDTGDLEVAGTVQCENFESSGRVELGDDSSDGIVIKGHIRQSDLIFDANSDDNLLTLRFEDPSRSQVVIFPDETGTVLTSVSPISKLRSIGALASGSIVPGFGNIVTGNNIETVGTGSVTSGGSFTAKGGFAANGDVYLGDSNADEIILRGTVVSSITFAPDRGLSFENEAKDKSMTIKATFTPTAQDSPAGDRVIAIPDVPVGGTLHVVTKESGKVNAGNNIQLDVSAGIIESFNLLGPLESEVLYLSNSILKPDSVVIATIADSGSGGLIVVLGAKVPQAEAGLDGVWGTVDDLPGGDYCSFVVQNAHPTAAMTTTYKVSFAVFTNQS